MKITARLGSLLIAAGTSVLAGCSTMNNTEKGAAVGTGMGAVVGTAIGAATGNPRTGAVVGALGGAAVGGAIGNSEDKRENREAIAQAHAQTAATSNQLGITDIITLVQQGTDADVIVNQIRSTGSTYNLSTSDIQFLTQQNIPPKVIQAMQTSRARPVVVAPQRVIVQEPGPAVIIAPRPYYYGGWGYCRHW